MVFCLNNAEAAENSGLHYWSLFITTKTPPFPKGMGVLYGTFKLKRKREVLTASADWSGFILNQELDWRNLFQQFYFLLPEMSVETSTNYQQVVNVND